MVLKHNENSGITAPELGSQEMASIRRLLVLLATTGGMGLSLISPVAAQGATTARPFDLNGDGWADLVVGVPGEAIGAVYAAGAVNVIYGSRSGLSAHRDQFWSQNTRGIAGASEEEEGFGAVVASADFNRDGRADLAVGVPDEQVGSQAWAGAVSVLYGSAAGLTAKGDQFWSQNSACMPGKAQEADHFGSSLAAGDFDGDGFGDLAVGVPFEGGLDTIGMVQVLYGSAAGLSARGAQSWTQNTPGIKSRAQDYEGFGSTLAAADANGDGYTDLAVSAPNDVSYGGSGVVHLILGSARGLTAAGDQLWSPRTMKNVDSGVNGLGRSLTFGDFNRDGRSDLAIGAPNQVVQPCDACQAQGAVHILFGANNGLTARGQELWHIGKPGLPGEVRQPNSFGGSLASGDFDGDGDSDLAAAARDANVDGHEHAGAVFVLHGSTSGLNGTDTVITQNTPGVPGAAESGDGQVMTLTADRYAGRTRATLVIGYPNESLGARQGAGALIAVPGSPTGLAPANSRAWTQNSPGILGRAERSDEFGHVSHSERNW